MGDGFVLHGDKAIKASKLTTHHELFTKNNVTAYEEISNHSYRCRPSRLPRPIKISLFVYLEHFSTRRSDVSIDSVFRTSMYTDIAEEYESDLKALIVSAFREGCQAWINTLLFLETSFLTATKLILKPLMRPRFGTREVGWSMIDALVEIVTASWGWMRHDEDIRKALRQKFYRAERACVEQEVEWLTELWEARLRLWEPFVGGWVPR
ncbi:hypothetical protein K458DRAFT_428056 [Lentithecium fluviatile CBS 122367]|uniref:Uncharacterized protein n=1 Tax=Lentithecium fluviatile CBS 122367 TaxID=1168545 RepID=A0A6G1JE21_9PLEO|nr:hypothetical protein K458DRAFT_428056 [Lentithecium fluviatile CBS 122367]